MTEELTAPEVDCPLDLNQIAPTRDAINAIEDVLVQCPQIAIETKHHFSAGLYAREILIPAGTILTGKIHRAEHLNIVSRGEITVWTEEGMRRIKAPFTMVSRPGTKRIGYAHTDTVWTTIHPNPDNSRDLIQLEDAFVLPSDHKISTKEASWLG